MLAYSFGYNATYMIPETIVLVAACVYITSAIDFSKEIPVRAKSGAESSLAFMRPLSGLAIFVAVLVDTVLVFSELQNAETGDFDLAGLANVDWLAFSVVTAACVLAAFILYIIGKKTSVKVTENVGSDN